MFGPVLTLPSAVFCACHIITNTRPVYRASSALACRALPVCRYGRIVSGLSLTHQHQRLRPYLPVQNAPGSLFRYSIVNVRHCLYIPCGLRLPVSVLRGAMRGVIGDKPKDLSIIAHTRLQAIADNANRVYI